MKPVPPWSARTQCLNIPMKTMNEAELLTAVAKGIRESRKKLGLTAERLAEASNIESGFLRHIEAGRKTPSLAALARIMKALEIGPEQLFRAAKGKGGAPRDANERRLVALYRGLKPQAKADLMAIFAKLRKPERISALRSVLRV